MRRSYPCLSSIQFYTARTVLPLESVVSVLACIMRATGNSSNGRCPATYFYLSISGLVGKWLYDHYLKLSTIVCVSAWMGDRVWVTFALHSDQGKSQLMKWAGLLICSWSTRPPHAQLLQHCLNQHQKTWGKLKGGSRGCREGHWVQGVNLLLFPDYWTATGTPGSSGSSPRSGSQAWS